MKIAARGVRGFTYAHGSMQSSSDIVVLFQPRTAAKNLGQPELADGALHVSDLALGRRRCLYPLRGFAADAAHHIGMREGLGGPLLGLAIERPGDGLGDARVERRGPTGDDEVIAGLIAGARAGFTVAGTRPREGRMSVE